MRIRDLISEGMSAIVGRPARSVLTMTGIALGVLAFTAMIGMSASSAATISSSFDIYKATRIEVSGYEDATQFAGYDGSEGLKRVERIDGAVSAGARFQVTDQPVEVGTVLSDDGKALTSIESEVYALAGRALDADSMKVVSGRTFDQGHADRGDPVVVIGDLVASRLHLLGNGRESVHIRGQGFQVLGVVTSEDLASPLPLSIMMPLESARTAGMSAELIPPIVTVRTEVGAAETVGEQAPLAMNPRHPEILRAAVPPRPERIQGEVESQTKVQLSAFAAVSLLIGAVGVSNTTLVSVLERRHEIGVRRAVGAGRRTIVAQFLVESGILGAVGGLVGMVLGLVVTLVVTIVGSWVAVVPPYLIGMGPAVGLIVGIIAGIYPATRAARIEPVEALRS